MQHVCPLRYMLSWAEDLDTFFRKRRILSKEKQNYIETMFVLCRGNAWLAASCSIFVFQEN